MRAAARRRGRGSGPRSKLAYRKSTKYCDNGGSHGGRAYRRRLCNRHCTRHTKTNYNHPALPRPREPYRIAPGRDVQRPRVARGASRRRSGPLAPDDALAQLAPHEGRDLAVRAGVTGAFLSVLSVRYLLPLLLSSLFSVDARLRAASSARPPPRGSFLGARVRRAIRFYPRRDASPPIRSPRLGGLSHVVAAVCDRRTVPRVVSI